MGQQFPETGSWSGPRPGSSLRAGLKFSIDGAGSARQSKRRNRTWKGSVVRLAGWAFLTAFGVFLGLQPYSAPAIAGEPAVPPEAETQEPTDPNALPDLGPPIFDDDMRAPGFVSAGVCRTGRNSREFVPEGFLLRVTGLCNPVDEIAGVDRNFSLILPDGEVRFELRALTGVERAVVRFWFRSQSDRSGYVISLWPKGRRAELLRLADGRLTDLGLAVRLVGLLDPASWHSVSLRLAGPRMWILLNDQVLLSATDDRLTSGHVGVRLDKLRDWGREDPDDPDEASLLIRNVRVSPLAGSDPERVPQLLLSDPAPLPTPAGPPRVERIYFSGHPDGRLREETDLSEVPAGTRFLYAFYDFTNFGPTDTLRAYWLLNGAPIGYAPPAFAPRVPADWGASYLWNQQWTPGTLTLVVEINGQEAARRDLRLT